MLENTIEINGLEALLKYLRKNFPNKIGVPQKGLFKKETRIVKKIFKGFSFKGDYRSVEIRSCKFINCTFSNLWAFDEYIDKIVSGLTI